MVTVQAVLDSFSRCFGAPSQTVSSRNVVDDVTNLDPQRNSRPGSTTSPGKSSNRYAEDGEALDVRRRSGRALGIELDDQEWDALFVDETVAGKKGKRGSNEDLNFSSHSGSRRQNSRPDRDIGYADALEKAKQAADPSRHASPRKIDRKSDIFRSKCVPNPSFASRLLGRGSVAKALCFANPVHDCANPVHEEIIVKAESYGANTVNTAEDTLTSTVCFEAKHSHLVETRPPMPLFNRYKVECDEIDNNTLIGIVKSGSHQSVHMIREFQEHADQNIGVNFAFGTSEKEKPQISSHKAYTNKERFSKDVKSGQKQTPPTEQPPGMQAISENSISTNPSSRSISSGNQQHQTQLHVI